MISGDSTAAIAVALLERYTNHLPRREERTSASGPGAHGPPLTKLG